MMFHLYICSLVLSASYLYSTLPDVSHNQVDFLKNYMTGFRLLRTVLCDEKLLHELRDETSLLLQFPYERYVLKYIPNCGYVYLDDIQDCIKNFLRRNVPWEREFISLIKNSVKPGTIAIDIGAHIGTHTLTMARAAGSTGTVFAFEPQRKIFAELYMNMVANQCDNVIPICCALGDMQALMKLRQDVPDNEGASYLMPGGIGEDVITVCLDDFHFNNVSFIKIDTENTEYAVLKGAYNTIMHNRPIILIEIQGNDVRAARNSENMHEQAQKVKDLLAELRYNITFLTCAEYLATPQLL